MTQSKTLATVHTHTHTYLITKKIQKTRNLIYNKIIKDSIKLVYSTG